MNAADLVHRVVAKFIGTQHERDIKRIAPMLTAINVLEPEMEKLSDADLKARAQQLREQVQAALGDADPGVRQAAQAALDALRTAKP